MIYPLNTWYIKKKNTERQLGVLRGDRSTERCTLSYFSTYYTTLDFRLQYKICARKVKTQAFSKRVITYIIILERTLRNENSNKNQVYLLHLRVRQKTNP